MSGEARVLNGLLQRRALEEAFAELSHITDPVAIQQRAEAIAAYGTPALHHLINLLDTPEPQLRGGLGQVARRLPREQVVPALRAAARNAERSDQARLAAATLLERFLGEQVDDAIIAGLRNPHAAAQQSLAELVAAMDDDPLSVVEYLEQLGQQPPEVVGMVLDALPTAAPSPHIATLLRMLAQGEGAPVARRALDELARLRFPAALRALASLAPNLPPALSPIAERSLRKMRFSGVSQTAEHDPRREPWYAPELKWRALMSPVDPLGGQFIWFIGQDEAGTRAVFFTILTQDPGGLRDAAGSLDVDPARVPPEQPVGALHHVSAGERGPGLTLLAAPPALACRALRQALALNWEAGQATPVGYRLFAPLIWLSSEAEGEHDEGEETAVPPDLTLTSIELLAAMGHPAFSGWLRGAPNETLSPAQQQSYVRRFRSMSAWLNVAGEEVGAALAATLAHHIENQTPEASIILAAAPTRRSGKPRRAGASRQHKSQKYRKE